MEDVMFIHKTRPLAAAFALAAAVIIGTISASAERRKFQDSYSAPYTGIVQKERDGVNYFYGSSDKTFGYTSYEVLRLDIDYTANAASDEIMEPRESIRYLPYGHSWRPWHKKQKHGHKGEKPWHAPDIFNKSPNWNKAGYPKIP
jgi:hypothetical protein